MTAGDYIAAIAAVIALGALTFQWFGYRRQSRLERDQASFGKYQQTLQQRVTQVEEARFEDEQRRKRRAFVTVQLPIGTVRGEERRETWVLLWNLGEAGPAT